MMSGSSTSFLCGATILYLCSNTAYACGWSPGFKPDVTDDVWETLHEHWKDIPADWMERVRGKDIRQIKQLLKEHNLPEDIATVAKQFRDSDSAENFRESLKNVEYVSNIRETQAGYSRYPSDIIRGSVSSASDASRSVAKLSDTSSILDIASRLERADSSGLRLSERPSISRRRFGRATRFARSANFYGPLHNLYKKKQVNSLHKT